MLTRVRVEQWLVGMSSGEAEKLFVVQLARDWLTLKAERDWAVEALAGMPCQKPVEPEPGTEGWLDCGQVRGRELCPPCKARAMRGER